MARQMNRRQEATAIVAATFAIIEFGTDSSFLNQRNIKMSKCGMYFRIVIKTLAKRRLVKTETQRALFEQRGTRIGGILPLLVQVRLLAVEDVDFLPMLLIQTHCTDLAV